MKYALIIKEPVNKEITEVFDYYEEQQVGLGYSLLDAIEEALYELKSNPLGCQVKYSIYRTKLVRPFPYVLIYEIIGKEIIIFQFFNARKLPVKRFKK